MQKLEELQAELAKAKAKRAEIVDRRAARNELLEAEQAIALELRQAADEEAIDEAEQEHGLLGVKIDRVDTECGVVIVKRPNHLIFKRFQELGRTKSEDFVKLVHPCLVHPSVSEFERYCEEQPATLLRTADAVATLAGVRGDQVRGK